MNRRDFLKGCVAAGIGFGMASLPWNRGLPLGAAESPGLPDMVAVRNGEPDAMFDRGIAAMGGIGRFVRPGQKVAIKPNISWDANPEYASNTHPALVKRIVQHCLDAGAGQVVVFDHCIEFWRNCWERSGIAAAVGEAGGVMAPGEAERYYHKVDVKGRTLTEALAHEAMLECDVLVGVPVLKHHGGAGITAGLKNFMGAVWDRRVFHARGLQQCIADFMTVRRPDLNVVDAYRMVVSNGPRSRSLADVKLARMQILSTDVVAADAAAARLMGKKPEEYLHIAIAHELGLGQIDPGKLVTRTITI